MPILLAKRVGTDTVPKLEQAADQRAQDAEALMSQGHALAAIYLFGYEAETRIKVAYFRFFFKHVQPPLDPLTPISHQLRNDATSEWLTLGLSVRPGPHDISGWAKLLIAKRREKRAAYDRIFEQTFSEQAERISNRWSEVLRYRANIPYAQELRAVREAVAWIRFRFHDL